LKKITNPPPPNCWSHLYAEKTHNGGALQTLINVVGSWY